MLSKREILAYIKQKKLKFDPMVPESAIEQVSIDLRLGRKFTRFKAEEELPGVPVLDVKSVIAGDALWTTQEADKIILDPWEFVLAHTLEKVTIPRDLVGMVEGRSSFARLGVGVHMTAPKIDPGWEGTITLEIVNVGPKPVLLEAEQSTPAQLMLMKLTSEVPPKEAYGGKPTKHIFYQQSEPLPRKRPGPKRS